MKELDINYRLMQLRLDLPSGINDGHTAVAVHVGGGIEYRMKWPQAIAKIKEITNPHNLQTRPGSLSSWDCHCASHYLPYE